MLSQPAKKRGSFMKQTFSVLVFVIVAFLPGFASPVWATPIITSASGPTAAAITPARDRFRLDLGGGTVAGANGLFGGVRREINWDGVPDVFSAPNDLPADFFNTVSPRGVIFSTPGTGFQVSANAGVAPIAFGNIDPSYSSTFAAFSPQRLFTARGSNIVDVNFFVPGTSTPAIVRGFGSVFSDVSLSDTTSIEYFDPADNPLGTFFAPATSGTQTFSFLGVSFDAGEEVARVRITNGTTALETGIANGGPVNLVVMDDFLYSEPTRIPEPAALLLVASGLAGLAGCAAWRSRRL
jgi:hypothetical protein